MKLYFIPVRYECNKNCDFCITKKQFTEKSHLPEKIGDYFYPWTLDLIKNFQEIEITGGGEPTLHENLPLLIKEIQDNAKNIKITLYTNGLIVPNYINKFDEVTISCGTLNNIYSDFIELDFIEHTIYEYRKYANKIRLKVILTDTDKDNLIAFLEKFEDLVDLIILIKDFDENRKTFIDNLFIYDPKIKIDLNERNCLENPIICTDGLIHKNWNFLLKNTNDNYHSLIDLYGINGHSSKIIEEVYEFLDSKYTNNKIMSIVELSDLYGSIESYISENFKNFSMQDLGIMSNITKRAFKNGARN